MTKGTVLFVTKLGQREPSPLSLETHQCPVNIKKQCVLIGHNPDAKLRKNDAKRNDPFAAFYQLFD